MKYYKGYKGPEMCKHCYYLVYSEMLHKNWCVYWNLSIRRAVYICKGIVELKDEKQTQNS